VPFGCSICRSLSRRQESGKMLRKATKGGSVRRTRSAAAPEDGLFRRRQHPTGMRGQSSAATRAQSPFNRGRPKCGAALTPAVGERPSRTIRIVYRPAHSSPTMRPSCPWTESCATPPRAAVSGRSQIRAIASLDRAIAIDPLSPRVNIGAGWVLLQAQHFGEAIAKPTPARVRKDGSHGVVLAPPVVPHHRQHIKTVLDRVQV